MSEITVRGKENTAKGTSRWLTVSTFVLVIFSTVMIASANITNTTTVVSDVTTAVVRQSLYIILAYGIYIFAIRYFSFGLVRKLIHLLIYVMAGLLIFTRFFAPVGGAYAWIRLGPLTLQPSEFAKALIILVAANYLCDIKGKKYKSGWSIIRLPLLTALAYTIIIVVVERDFGSGFALFAVFCFCLLVPSNKMLRGWQIAIVCTMILVSLATVYLMSPGFKEFITSEPVTMWLDSGSTLANFFSKISYQFYRFISAGDPLWDRFGYSQELLNSLLGMSRGNIYGIGLGNSIQKFGYLASADADYIFPVIVEELGIIGILLVFVPYLIIYFVLIKYALLVKKEKEKVVLIGTFAYLFVHMFLNIGGVSAFIPLTGVPLLMVSRSGSALLSIMACLGMCQNIIRKYNQGKENNES